MSHNLETVVEKNKSQILKMWFKKLVSTYPPDTAQFLQAQKDPFANPVGSTVDKGMGLVLDQLIDKMDSDAIQSALTPIVRIRAVQNFTPSQAVSFIFSLKKIVRDVLKSEKMGDRFTDQLESIDTKIDTIALIAFDVYFNCREKIYHLKANEAKNRFYSAFERAGLIKEFPDENKSVEVTNQTKEGPVKPS